MIKELDETQKDLLFTNLDNEGKLSCLKAFKVARLIGVKPKDMDAITKHYGIDITNCELGVFGKLRFSDPDHVIYKSLSANFTQEKTLDCEIAWEMARAKGATLKTVGSTIKNSDIKVRQCQLGSF